MRSLLLVCALASTAAAQSTRYPPEPVDKDIEKEQRSSLWESASKPRTAPYEKLLAEARAALSMREDGASASAVDTLTGAIALLPDESSAYALRGDANLSLRRWSACADDFAAAQQRTPVETIDRRVAQEQRRKLGLCLARAGRLAEAESVLAEAALTGASTGEMLMRLGEVRIAMGKLDEAISALQLSVESNEGSVGVLARWLLASAYDRARRTGEAIEAARLAVYQDREATQLRNPTLPLLGAGEMEYLLGIAAEYGHADAEPGQPERALVYFRRYLALAPASPWRRRAEEHIRDLKASALPEALIYRSGNAKYDLVAARALVRKSMPALRACMAKTPGVVYAVVVTRAGPIAAPRPDLLMRRSSPSRAIAPPPSTIQLEVWNDSEPGPKSERDAAQKCLDTALGKIAWPKVTEQDAWVQFWFSLTAL